MTEKIPHLGGAPTASSRDSAVIESNQDVEILASLLESYKEEYEDLSKVWNSLDAKSQGTAAIAATFLAAVLVFLKDLTSSSSLWDRILISLIVGGLILVFAIVLRSLRVATVQFAPSGTQVEKLVKDLIASPNEISDRFSNFLRDQHKAWSKVNEQIADVNAKKSAGLAKAQFVMGAVMLVAGIFILCEVWM